MPSGRTLLTRVMIVVGTTEDCLTSFILQRISNNIFFIISHRHRTVDLSFLPLYQAQLTNHNHWSLSFTFQNKIFISLYIYIYMWVRGRFDQIPENPDRLYYWIRVKSLLKRKMENILLEHRFFFYPKVLFRSTRVYIRYKYHCTDKL